ATWKTLWRVDSRTCSRPFSAFDAVAMDTPAMRATSLSVGPLRLSVMVALSAFRNDFPVTVPDCDAPYVDAEIGVCHDFVKPFRKFQARALNISRSHAQEPVQGPSGRVSKERCTH